MSDAARPQWAGQRAMSWVIDDAPVPTALFPVLIVIARRCDEHGRGSYQSVPTIADRTGKSADQVKKDIRDLLKAGLLLPGDESLVAHFPVWSRPKVYDVPLHISGPKPTKQGRNKEGVNRQGGCMDTPGGTGTPGCMEAPGGGGTDTPGVGVRVHPKQSLLRTQENNPSLSPREDEQPTAANVPAQRTERENEEASQKPETEEPNPIHRLLLDAGCPFEDLTDVVEELVKRHQPRSPAWWRTVSKNGDLPDLVAEVLEALQPVLPQFSADHIAEAHPYEAKDDGSPDCKHCRFPKANGRHRVGNQGGGYIAQVSRSTSSQRAADILAAGARLRQGLDEYGNGMRGGYHHLTDSRAPNRDYHEPLAGWGNSA